MSSSPPPRVAFQGEHGAFSEDAALKLLGSEIQLVPRRTFETLFTSLDEGLAEYVLVPVENSLIGAIQPAVDLLNKSSLGIVGRSGNTDSPVIDRMPGRRVRRDCRG